MKPELSLIRARHDLTAQEIDALEDCLYAFNAERSGRHDAAPLGFVAEIDGSLIAIADAVLAQI
jgi:hypothetical protein